MPDVTDVRGYIEMLEAMGDLSLVTRWCLVNPNCG